jgi:hypothetical protein
MFYKLYKEVDIRDIGFMTGMFDQDRLLNIG